MNKEEQERIYNWLNGVLNDLPMVYIDQLRAEIAHLEQKLFLAEKIFTHFGGLNELAKWENADGESAASVVQDYLEL